MAVWLFGQGGPTAQDPVQYLSVVVGYNRTTDASLAPLRFADDDAARFFELFSRASEEAWLLTRFDRRSREIFPGLVAKARRPTLDSLLDVFEQVAKKAKELRRRGVRVEVQFYYAGHGDVDDEGGFVHLEDGRLTRDTFAERFISGIPADRKHVFIDACRSYFLVASRGPGGRRVPVSAPYAGPTRRPGVGYVLSTSNDAESHEWAELEGGIFSHEVRSALVGGADANLDGRVDYTELAAFVAVANEGIPQARYRPRFWVQAPDADPKAALFEPGRLPGSTQLSLAPTDAGRVRVIDGRGLPYADLNKQRGGALSLALLSPGAYTVAFNQKRLRVDAGPPRMSLAALPPAPPESTAARSQPHEAFAHLFSAPFGADVVRGMRLGMDLAPDPVRLEVPKKSRWVPPVLLSSGLVLAAGGAAMLAGAASLRSDLNDPNLSQVDRTSRANTADALLVSGLVSSGAALIAGTVGVWLWGRP